MSRHRTLARATPDRIPGSRAPGQNGYPAFLSSRALEFRSPQAVGLELTSSTLAPHAVALPSARTRTVAVLLILRQSVHGRDIRSAFSHHQEDGAPPHLAKSGGIDCTPTTGPAISTSIVRALVPSRSMRGGHRPHQLWHGGSRSNRADPNPTDCLQLTKIGLKFTLTPFEVRR